MTLADHVLADHELIFRLEVRQLPLLQHFDDIGHFPKLLGYASGDMDDIQHPECELYVEDEAARTLVTEMLSQRDPDIGVRVLVTTFGSGFRRLSARPYG